MMILSWLTGIISWLVILVLAYSIYKKQAARPKIWKIIIVMLIGIFSFSFQYYTVKISILPLGVWILYAFLKGKEGKWQKYRKYAWLGFWANFIFLASALLTSQLNTLVYPPNEPSTYLANVENVSINPVHPSAKAVTLDEQQLRKQIQNLKPEIIESEVWYRESRVSDEEYSKRNERFPYQLIGISSRWGSGIQMVIYLEDDGKGILITTPQKQHYFRSDVTLIKGAE
jgi:hypothetical protein